MILTAIEKASEHEGNAVAACIAKVHRLQMWVSRPIDLSQGDKSEVIWNVTETYFCLYNGSQGSLDILELIVFDAGVFLDISAAHSENVFSTFLHIFGRLATATAAVVFRFCKIAS